jgi:hypothetical protein
MRERESVHGIVPSVRDLARETVDGDKLPAAGETWEGYRVYADRSISLGNSIGPPKVELGEWAGQGADRLSKTPSCALTFT